MESFRDSQKLIGEWEVKKVRMLKILEAFDNCRELRERINILSKKRDVW
jgi:hypothetical protein